MSDFRADNNFCGSGMMALPVGVVPNAAGVRSTPTANGGGASVTANASVGGVAPRPGDVVVGDPASKGVVGVGGVGAAAANLAVVGNKAVGSAGGGGAASAAGVMVVPAVPSPSVGQGARGLRNCSDPGVAEAQGAGAGAGGYVPSDERKGMGPMEGAVGGNCPIEIEDQDAGGLVQGAKVTNSNANAGGMPKMEGGGGEGGGGGGGSGASNNPGGKYVDIYREKPIRVTVKVLVPVKEHPKFNFVGKLLGPKGNSMKRLQEETMTKMAVLGRGSMRDKLKEAELRACGDPKYSHLSEELHVEVTGYAAPAEAHARVAYALAALRKYLIPDNNDEIRQQQMREMEILSSMQQEAQLVPAQLGEDGEGVPTGLEGAEGPPGLLAAAVDAAPANGGRALPLGIPRRAVRAGGSVRGRFPPLMRGGGAAGGMPVRGGGIVASMRKPPPPHLAPPGAVLHARPSPTKQKVMSILERARAVMEESYGMEGVRAPGADEDGAEEVAGGGLLGGRAGGGGLYYGAYNTYDPTGYGGYEDYDDGAGDYYDSADSYTARPPPWPPPRPKPAAACRLHCLFPGPPQPPTTGTRPAAAAVDGVNHPKPRRGLYSSKSVIFFIRIYFRLYCTNMSFVEKIFWLCSYFFAEGSLTSSLTSSSDRAPRCRLGGSSPKTSSFNGTSPMGRRAQETFRFESRLYKPITTWLL
ncbi:uncharacterized protein [Hetaerina americana]|uniref:uncharacterized protein n=1 Tax=Hetaerina americana TaxID=62018 RepID=UPI003A7F1891